MAENAPPPFLKTQESSKLKRNSLNISPGPRPLHLASGSVLSSPSHSPPRSSALHNSNANSPVLGKSHYSTGSLSPIGASSVKNGRRQSSISYLPSNRDKDSLLSPLSPTRASRGKALTSSNSAAPGSPGVEMEEGSRVTIGPTKEVTLDALKDLKRRPPATLAEKHAELLHFIAQKESKCLELRSQLATHEAELLQLKRKWERIVNRGFEKSSFSSFPSPSPPSSIAPASYLYPSLTTSAASSSSGVVLEGIKEGVQGMGRLITAGLGSIAHVGITEGNTYVSSPTGTLSSTLSARKSSKFPVPLRLGSGNSYGHESQSSSSTTASVTTVASSSTSATSFMLEEGTTQVLSPPFTPTINEVSNEYDEFGDFEEAPTRSLNELAEQEENPEQMLIVDDTGATPTMSPNPHFQRSRTKVEQKDPTCDISESDFNWDDGWTTSGALTTAIDSVNGLPASGSRAQTSSPSPTTQTVQPVHTKPPKISRPSLPGVSSIPGLASSSMSTNGTTTPQSMSTWVGSVGKKWGEIRESQTFTKSQKRASILLSDVSQSIVSALISPSPLSATLRSVTTSKSPVENPFATNAFHPSSHSINAESMVTPNKNDVPISTSLLDDLDFGEVDEALTLGIGSPVLVPDQASKEALNPNTKLEVKDGPDMVNVPGVSPSNSFNDDWNW
ncbi:hypothetical protein BYT27DRAFT_7258962 [Phlegmacium glaucopus]|nr:hypothetical protein BYT27DRAFT_7258962 [Phlegmacium glaucopus]